jgi:dimethylargininase
MSLTAITRDVSQSINECELAFHGRHVIDLGKAIAQHQAYRDCLAELGARIVSLPAEPGLPDAVFVEDAAVVLDEIAVIANMGAVCRRPEAASLADALARYRPLQFLTAPATLDGGDVMRIGRILFVGLSRRTNRQGVEQLRELVRPHGYEVQPLEVRGCLHLKSACSYVGNNTILVNRSWIDVERLRGFELLDVDEEELAAANALLLKDVVIMPGLSSQSRVPGFPSRTPNLGDSRRKVWPHGQTLAFFPKTCILLEERGFRVRAVDVSELQKAEAGVTCCSVIFEGETGVLRA